MKILIVSNDYFNNSNGMCISTQRFVTEFERTTLDIYTHITDTMQLEAANTIDRGIGKNDTAEPDSQSAADSSIFDFAAYKPKRRRPGTGYVKKIGENTWEGRILLCGRTERNEQKTYTPIPRRSVKLFLRS
ncbi:MAG: hypothetical protein IJP43_05525 [Oscillospiraceae bacterium]|nr:hypothetical protein [Oscillospiraceae bacterium]